MTALLGGALGAAIATGIFSIILWKLKRTAEVEDREGGKLQAVMDGMQVFFYDRVKYLANASIEKGQISEPDREMLKKMHEAYKKFGGDGYLEDRMEKVMNLRGENER